MTGPSWSEDIEFDQTTGLFRTTYDPESNVTLSTLVTMVVAVARDVTPTEIERVESAVDPDALDTIFTPIIEQSEGGTGQLSFMLSGCEVNVHADGGVVVTAKPLDDISEDNSDAVSPSSE